MNKNNESTITSDQLAAIEYLRKLLIKLPEDESPEAKQHLENLKKSIQELESNTDSNK